MHGSVDQTTALAFAYVDLAPLLGVDLGPVEHFTFVHHKSNITTIIRVPLIVATL